MAGKPRTSRKRTATAAVAASPLRRRIARAGGNAPVVKLTPRRIASAMERTYRIRGARELLAVKDLFQLSSAELGQLFGNVSRQAIDQWLDKGVPTDRVADVDRVAEIARVLGKLFKKQRLPAIVRSPLPGLRDRSVLDVLRTQGIAPVNAFLEQLGAMYGSF